MLALVPAWLLVMTGWAFWALVFIGVGAAVAPLIVGKGRLHSAEVFWLGWASAITVLQVWHLMWPVDAKALFFCILPLAAFGLWSTGPALRVQARRASIGATAVFLGLAAFAACWAVQAPGNEDLCLYHQQTIRWLTAFPIVPGIGNLYSMLAANHSYYLYVALLDVGPFSHGAQHLATGLLFLTTAFPTLKGVWHLGKSALNGASARFNPSHLTAAVLLICVIGQILDRDMASPSGDGAVWSLNALLVSTILPRSLAGQRLSPERYRVLAFIAIVGLAVKTTSVFVSLPFVALATWRVASEMDAIDRRRLAMWWGGASTCVLVPWMLRGIIQSGYPLFPYSVFDLHLDWRIPAPVLRDLGRYLSSYAHLTSGVSPPSLTGWIPHWWSIALRDDTAWCLMLSIVVLLLAVTLRSRLGNRPATLACIATLLLWFFVAPAPRFLAPFLPLTMAAVSMSLPTAQWRRPLGLICLTAMVVTLVPFTELKAPRSILIFHAHAPVTYDTRRLSSGDYVLRGHGCCLDLPCGFSPQIDTVQMRTPGSLKDGFRSMSE